jgi:dTDP-6-deoxy-L-talose 4-dehydrogenase (NAD+)
MTRAVLLTGACGFVGRQVLRVLAEQAVKVRVVVRNGSSGKLPVLDAIDTVITTPDLFGEPADWWAKACVGIDTVIHVAWYAEPGKYLQSERNIDCLAGTLQMAKGAARAEVRRFVGIGTCVEYDLAGGVLSVDTPLRPVTPYAGAKAAAFMALSQWLPSQNVEFAWCRLFYLHGEGEDQRRLVPYLRSRLAAGEPANLTSGDQIRDFLDVREAGKLIAEIALSTKQGAVNVCSGIPITVRKFAEQIADEYGRRDLLAFGARSDNPLEPSRVVGVPFTASV